MGLSSFWSNITGPKVKEITPQTKCKWLDKAKPGTSASSVHSAKSTVRQRLKPEILIDARPATGTVDKKLKKTNRGLSTSKQENEGRTNLQTKDIGKRKDPAEKELPDLPSISPTSPPEINPSAVVASAEEPIRPGTAITTDGSVATEIFELSGAPSPPLHSPSSSIFPALPSPSSLPPALSERSSVPPVVGSAVGLRKRSNSTTSGKSGKSRLKRASWFHRSKTEPVDIEQLPPPLPPPTGPPPPPPPIQPLVAELPDNGLMLKRSLSLSSGMAHSPVSPITKTSLDSDSILMAFPSVPSPVHGNTIPPRPGRPNSGRGDVPSNTLPYRKPFGGEITRQFATVATAKPHNVAPMQTIDALLKVNTGVTATAKRDSKLRITGGDDREHLGDTGLSFSEELQREYDKVTRMLGQVNQVQSKGAAASVEELDSRTAEQRDSAKQFSNEEALAALKFDI